VLETLEVLGNAGVVPVVIFFTQLCKKKFGALKHGSDFLALGLSMTLCLGWAFYYMTPESLSALVTSDALSQFRWWIDQLIVGFATWLAASKIYDLGHGDKKKEKKFLIEKEELVEEGIQRVGVEKLRRKNLEEEIVKLKNGHGDMNGKTEEDPIIADKLRNILEG